jgi:3-phenylpropionate/cinnamic acid dioxygenase small subunit
MVAKTADNPEHGSAGNRTVQDEHDIAALLFRWGHARDCDDWETLAACFHDDATIHISWISAPAAEFVARSREMASKRTPGYHIKHLIGGPWIEVNRDRAFARCHVNLYIRAQVEGHDFDVQSWFRFFDLLEKRDRVWRIVKRTAVYEKDRMDPVDPRGVPDSLFAAALNDVDFCAFPPAAKFLCYLQQLSGRATMTDMVSVYSDEEAALAAAGRDWLAGG